MHALHSPAGAVPCLDPLQGPRLYVQRGACLARASRWVDVIGIVCTSALLQRHAIELMNTAFLPCADCDCAKDVFCGLVLLVGQVHTGTGMTSLWLL